MRSPAAAPCALQADSRGWARVGAGGLLPPWPSPQTELVPHWGTWHPTPSQILSVSPGSGVLSPLTGTRNPGPNGEEYGSVRVHIGTQPAPLKSPALTREANGHEVGPRGQTHGHSKERQWDLLHHLQAASTRLWGRGPLALRPVPPQPWGPQAPSTTERRTCLLLAEAIEDHLGVHAKACAHQQRRVPGAEGSE